MPIYEYRCSACNRRTSVFVRKVSDPEGVACQHCGSPDLERAISSFAHHRTMAGVWEASGPPGMSPGDDYYKDPRNIGRWTEERLGQLGVDMPKEAQEMIDAARDGTMPEPLNDL